MVTNWAITPGFTPFPLVIAHRGASGIAPENTVEAFQLALQCGADGIELDVRLTSDGVPVAMHDRKVDRTTSGVGAIGTLPLSEVRQLDAGTWFAPEFRGAKVPTLDEVFEALPGSLLINVELKVRGPGSYRLASRVVETIQRHNRTASTLIASFNPTALWTARCLAPDIVRGYIWSRTHPLPMRQRWFQWLADPHWMNPAQHTCPPATIQRFHAKGLLVLGWATDYPATSDGHQQWSGVDAVVTDFPQAVLEQRG